MSWVWRFLSWRWLLVLALLAGGAGLAWPQFRALYHWRAAEQALARQTPAEARRHLEVCASTWPTNASIRLRLARAARQLGFHEEADRLLTLSAELGGRREDINLERLLLEVQQGRLSLSKDYRIQELLDQNHPDQNEILDVASQAYMQSYRLHSARYCLDRLLERSPDDLQTRMKRGWVLERLFQTRDAEADYREAVKRHPDSDEARLRLAQILLFLQEPQEAVDILEPMMSRNPSPPVAAALGGGLRALGRAEEGYRILSEALSRFPREAPLWLERGQAALDLQRLDDAVGDLRQAASLSADDYQINYQLSLALRRQGKIAEAETFQARATRIQADQKRMAELSDLLQARPYDATVRSEMGELMLRHGEVREGVLWLRSALQVVPDFAPAHRALAEHFEKTKQPALAEPHRRFLATRQKQSPPDPVRSADRGSDP